MVVAVKSRLVADVMMIYFEMETSRDIQFATYLTKLWQELVDRVDERHLFIGELKVLTRSLVAFKCVEFLRKVLLMISEVKLQALADLKSILIYVRGVPLILASMVLSFIVLEKSIIEMCELNTEYNWERIRIMPPRMTTRSAGRATAAPRGGRAGGRTGRGNGRTRGRTGDLGNGGIDEQGGQGNDVDDGVDGVLDFSTIIAQQL
ncbi:hypothetical protein Tco_0601771 [Tanacetum coccineum]